MSSFTVEKMQLTNGQTLSFGVGDIVLVVGRNSSGKSTFLREVMSCVQDHQLSRKIIASASFRGSSESELRARVLSYFRVVTEGALEYVPNNRGGGMEFHLPSFGGGPDKLRLGKAARAFVTLLNAEGRLSLTHDVQTVDIHNSKPDHPFHVFMVEPSKLKRTSKIIKRAFGLELTINRIGNPIRGYVANEFEEQDSLSSEKSLPDEAEPLVRQGDGLRSFAGIIAEMDAMSHPLILVDEPEALLHPPQAKRLGRNMVDSLSSERQAFIATHNSNFLQGAIAQLSERLRVFRLERDSESFRVLDISHNHLKQAEALPSVANSNLLDSLFYDQTIICEADADCKLFESLVSDEDADRFWFSAGGKQQFNKVARLLTAFGVDWRAVLDLDVLLDWPILADLAELKGLDVSGHKKRVSGGLKAMQAPDLAAVRAAAASTLARTDGDDATVIRDALRELAARKTSTPLKEHGLSALPKGQERAFVEDLLVELATVGILLLRKGELESYVPTVGMHGPGWVNSVLLDKDRYVADLTVLKEELRKVT